MTDPRIPVSKDQAWRSKSDPDRIFVIGDFQPPDSWTAICGEEMITVDVESLHKGFTFEGDVQSG